MKTILVPTDFSPVALNALHYALALAKDLSAKIILYHSYQIPVTFSEVPVVTISLEELQKESDAKLQELKNDAEHITSHQVPIEAHNVLGDVVEELETMCKNYRPFAVVMGTKGAGAIERMIIGSSTLAAIKRLDVPVLIVPPGASYKPIHKIGFACDFNHVKDTIPVTEIEGLVNTFNASLHILNVDYNEKHFTGDLTAELTEMQELIGHLHPKYNYINSKHVEEGINAFADANHIDLLLTVPKKHNFWESIFRKSQSSELVLHSHLPIVAVHK
jgi:nucleotide-binding universal stress UspA family protein